MLKAIFLQTTIIGFYRMCFLLLRALSTSHAIAAFIPAINHILLEPNKPIQIIEWETKIGHFIKIINSEEKTTILSLKKGESKWVN